MRRLTRHNGALVLSLLAGLAVLALACDGEGVEQAPSSPTPAPTETAVSTPTQGPTATAVSSPTPASGVSPTPEASETPISATLPDDPVAFFEELQSQALEREVCDEYDFDNGLLSCGERGSYALSPDPQGEDVMCELLLVEGDPVAIACTDQSSLQSVQYEVTE